MQSTVGGAEMVRMICCFHHCFKCACFDLKFILYVKGLDENVKY